MKILIFLCALIFVESQPADPNANEKTKQLLNFIVNVPKQGLNDIQKVIDLVKYFYNILREIHLGSICWLQS